MGCNAKCLGTTGLIFTILFGIFGILGLILVSLSYKMTNFNWISGARWESLSVVAIISLCIVIVIMVIGIIEFTCCLGSRGYGVFYVIIQMICLLFCMIISILGLVASDVGKIEDYIGCNSNYTGVFKYWNNIDYLIGTIDYYLCSDECPCDFTNAATREFEANATVKPTFDKYVKSGENLNFTTCPQDTRRNVAGIFELKERFSGNHLHNLNVTQFGEYWEYIEEKFECTGWCSKSYTVDWIPNKPSEKRNLYKYLFRGINHGIVKEVGCLSSMIDWIKPRLGAFGCISFICSIIGIITWIFGIALLCGCTSLQGNTIPKGEEKKDNSLNTKKDEEIMEMKSKVDVIKVEGTDKTKKK